MNGGTSLRKLFFGDYRFSTDLDFTSVDSPKQEELEREIQEAGNAASDLLQQCGNFRVDTERFEMKEPHPGGQEAFKVMIQFPWHGSFKQSIKIEITHDEPIILNTIRKPLIHDYDNHLNTDVLCYRLEEILAEKLRAVLQQEKTRQERGWARPRGRDFYDIWYVLKSYNDDLELQDFPRLVKKKCKVRNVDYASIHDFFPKNHIAEIRKTWKNDVGRFVFSLPDFSLVLEDLKSLLESIFS